MDLFLLSCFCFCLFVFWYSAFWSCLLACLVMLIENWTLCIKNYSLFYPLKRAHSICWANRMGTDCIFLSGIELPRTRIWFRKGPIYSWLALFGSSPARIPAENLRFIKTLLPWCVLNLNLCLLRTWDGWKPPCALCRLSVWSLSIRTYAALGFTDLLRGKHAQSSPEGWRLKSPFWFLPKFWDTAKSSAGFPAS